MIVLYNDDAPAADDDDDTYVMIWCIKLMG